MSTRVLIVDDEENICFTLKRFLQDESYEVHTAEDYDQAIAALESMAFDLVLADIILKGKTGVDILRKVNEMRLTCPVVIITGVPTIETASEAVRLGAFDYLPKPVLQDALLRASSAALRHKALLDEKDRYRTNLEAIFRSVKDALISVDRDMAVLESNDAAERICGLDRKSSSGKPLQALAGHCARVCVATLQKTIETRRSTEVHHVRCHHQGRSDQVVSLSAYPLIDRRGDLSGGILVVRDDTRLAVLERDLQQRHQLHRMVGKSEKMQAIYSLIEDLADVPTTVLITGESGTGKELVADAIHFMGTVADRPLVKVNCAALSENLLESELFGHVKGAFSGAHRDKIGRFERAHGGTLFLDEVGEMSSRMQLRLLRVLQEKEFERVGDATPVKVDVRVVAATNTDLNKAVEAGKFRRDLYYRLKVMQLHLPPLKQRREDIPLLVTHFIEIFNRRLGKSIHGISSQVERLFMGYSWPGNVRELKHALEHAFILCRGRTIVKPHLPSELIAEMHEDDSQRERRQLLRVLEAHHWNKSKAARHLGISRQSLYRKMHACGIAAGN